MTPKIPTIPHDKAQHFVWGAVAALVGYFYSLEAGAALCAAVAVGREAWQYARKTGTPSVADIAWTLAGGLAVLLKPIVALAA